MSKTHPPAPRPIESSDERLDEALGETFPASDPIAVDAAEPEGEAKHGKTARAGGSAKDKEPQAKRPPPPAR
ncbi:hypothetical protein B0G57_101199 [Trinickia symbiotica]|uniref:Uncharacterized protein n=1 Tax=Trinickia symbiotica TaxID=863227 RepID=A0A2N7X9E7_9BURK|nr:hypothetical protein [Trinickia symbiotica]PMS38095.1 hypothetical protein C0Z20_04690 [Trinickia symbiotica]PPK47235.1 hypothetical protein B0G57_101199 [Trinickia symbiotica]